MEAGYGMIDDIDRMLEALYTNARDDPDHMYISMQTYREFMYARQGRRYPMPRKRKSQARMSRKWRKP